MKKFLAVFIFNLIALQACAQFAFFDAADAFFQAHVKDGKVAYSQLKANNANLHALLKQIGSFDADNADLATQKSFYINAYNICAIAGIANHYPVEGPLAIEGFFDKTTYLIGGKQLSLNQLENDVIRPAFHDPRIHFALVCAAESCPKLLNHAYRPHTLDKQLEAQTEASLNDTHFIRVYDSEKKVLISKIFEWYAQDFGGKDAFIPFINHYKGKQIPKGYQVNFYDYSWKLNAQ